VVVEPIEEEAVTLSASFCRDCQGKAPKGTLLAVAPVVAMIRAK
jgi:hypothetical protein